MAVIGTALQNKRDAAHSSELRSQMAKVKTQIDFGRKDTDFLQLQTSEIAEESSHARTSSINQTYKRNCDKNALLLSSQKREIKKGLSALQEFKGSLIDANNQIKLDHANLAALAQNLKEVFDSILKSRNGDAYIFAGTNSAQTPIDTSDGSKLLNGTFYLGSNSNKKIHKNDLKEAYDLGINGGQQGFKDAYKAIQTILDNPKNLTKIREAQDLIDNAFTDLNTAYSMVGSQEKILENTSNDNEAKGKKEQEAREKLTSVEMANLIQKHQQAKFALSASYMLASKPLSFLQFIQNSI